MTDIKIIKPSKTAMSSGLAKTKMWHIKFNEFSEKFRDPLMGWTSGSDTRHQMKLKFESLEDAIRFADSKGYSYDVVENNDNSQILKSYGDNFSPDTLKK